MLEYDVKTRRWTIQINEWKYRVLEKQAAKEHKKVSSLARRILEDAADELLDKNVLTEEDEKIVLERISENMADREAKRRGK